MTSTVPRRTALRGLAVTAAGTGAGALAACTAEPRPAPSTGAPSSPAPSTAGTATATPTRHEVTVRSGDDVVRLDPGLEPSLAATAVLDRCTAVVLAAPDAPHGPAVALARRLGLPLLLDGPGLTAALERLGTRTVVRAGSGGTAGTDLGDREVVEAGGAGTPDVAGLPAETPSGRLVAVEAPAQSIPAVVRPLLEALGAPRRRLAGTDPRTVTGDAAWLRRRRDAVVLAVGALGERFAGRVRTVRRAPVLPGGGWLPFASRRMVALYGHPRTAALGLLGEQGPQASVARARSYARAYERLTDERVLPAFEIIATVAAGSAGPDRTYSNRTAVGDLLPWVEVARESGVYVVLDLQPGREDFLDQAKAYERILREPHVGLALDPEWRLGPAEKPLEQIGHVGIAEVNRVGRWLAALVREHDLPPKVLALHQFRTSMVRDREDLDTGLDEIQWLVHADGQGGQGAKQGTWDAVRADLPDGVFLGWKNFVDEDAPMLTPAQTVAQVRPRPSFVSYQ